MFNMLTGVKEKDKKIIQKHLVYQYYYLNASVCD